MAAALAHTQRPSNRFGQTEITPRTLFQPLATLSQPLLKPPSSRSPLKRIPAFGYASLFSCFASVQALGHELFPTSSNMFPMDERLKYFAATGQAPPTDFGPGHDNMFLTVRPTSGPGVSGGQPTALFTGTGTIGDGGLAGGTIGTNASATWGARSPGLPVPVHGIGQWG